MTRVAKDRVVICDNTFVSDISEEADRLRDPSHVRNYAVAEWRSLFEASGLEVRDEQFMMRPLEIDPWLLRAGCAGAEADRVRGLLAERIVDGWMDLPTVVLKGVKR
jgi:hypothetical protein